MLFASISRANLLQLLPKGGEVAEIGVCEGDFSAEILRRAQPRRLTLIDPWEHQARQDYARDINNVADDAQEQRFRHVSTRFAQEIAAGQVEILRAYSQDVAARFAPGQLDFIYIDGLHSYDGVSSDLRHYKDKVKPDGLILGHDYTNHISARQMNFGVIEAVNEFVAREGFSFVALTHERWPTYVLTRNPKSPAAEQLRAQLIYHVPVVELRDFPASARYQHHLVEVGGQHRMIPSF